ncbi:MAG: metalloregulator ArsR/SmtB family transcription factor [Planctomycetota bacterium]|nr:metalloregulator ArsR/SmtB family transcription factor [Planctomycetota bacterium]
MDELIAVHQALSDGSRLRLLAACRRGELCVCQLAALIGCAMSTVSRHLSILKDAGLVESRKEGRWMHYRLAAPVKGHPAREAMKQALSLLEGDAQVAADDARLDEILEMDPEVLCQTLRDGVCCSSAPGRPVEARSRRGGRGRSSEGVLKRMPRGQSRRD